MDIIEKCELITNNSLIINRDTAKNAKIDLEIYNEIKNEIISELENIINPIIQDYKTYVKNNFYKDFPCMKDKVKNIIPEYISRDCNEKIPRINELRKALNAINEKIKEITSNND